MNEKRIQFSIYFKIIISFLIFFYFINISKNPSDWHFFENIHLVFHEAGHFIFYILGDFLEVAGGSILQLIIPILFFCYFIFKDQMFSASLILFWIGNSFINISVYAGDALKMELPLLGGESVIHDWNYMLSSLKILNLTQNISDFLFFLGIVLYFLALLGGVYFCIKDKNKI